MPRSTLIFAIIGLVLIFIAANSMFIVRQDRQVIVLRFGEYVRTINAPGSDQPGLYFKVPFAETVSTFDKRNIGLTLVGQLIVPADQEQLRVDAMVRWQILDPRLFYQSAITEEIGAQRLETFTELALRRALGGASSDQIISQDRSRLMAQIEADLNASAAGQLGVRIIDVRIRQVDFPDETRERIYERMASERQQVAERIRAEGRRDATVIRATAQQESEQLRGQGEGERARIFAQAYGRDPEFAAFYRSMRAYNAAIDENTPIIISPDSDFFRYMQNRRGGR